MYTAKQMMRFQFTYISESTKTRNNCNPALENISKEKNINCGFPASLTPHLSVSGM